MSLKDISIYDRPREKAEIYGVKTLSDIELLAIIIETGYRGENVLSLAAKLLEKSGGLSNLSKLNLSELNIKGLKKAMYESRYASRRKYQFPYPEADF